MWSDNETNLDYIDFQHLINATKSIIDNDELLPCSIGIYGDWGGGKSSLMKMIEDHYKEEENILVIRFNGWLFEGYEDTKTVLLGRIVDDIIKNRKLSDRALKTAAKLLRKIDLLKLTGSAIKYGAGFAALGPVGVAGMSLADAMGSLKSINYEDYLKENNDGNPDDLIRNNIQEFHQNFEELIAETHLKKVIVFIDDLDRCSPETIIGTLEAIKLFLFTKKTAFVIGADERLIKYAVRKRFPEIPGDNSEVGRDYLEKLIQYPIRIPPLSQMELSIYINLLFTQLFTDPGEFEHIRSSVLEKKNEDQFGFSFNLNNAGDFINEVSDSLKEVLLLAEQIIPILTVGLNGNPRQTKRFLNTLLLRSKMANVKKEGLNKRILAKLMLLEYFKSETFKDFYEEQASNSGNISNIKILEEVAQGIKDESENFKELTQDHQNLFEDSWIKQWLASEPSLSGVDLQPYFYVSRDKLSVSGVNIQRMSSEAQVVLRKLLQASETIRTSAIKASKNLSQGDAVAVFEAIKVKIIQSDDLKGENSPLKILFDFCNVRKELMSQLLSMLKDLPERLIPPVAVTQLIKLGKNTGNSKSAGDLVLHWSKSESNKTLATIAKGKIKNT